MDVVCVACGGELSERDGGLGCAACGAAYDVIDGIPVLVQTLSAQHVHQRAYFDAEFSAYGPYEVENWRRSFNERVFRALRLDTDADSYLDVGVGGSGATVIEAARVGVRAIGCDLSPVGVRAAARHARSEGFGERTSFVVCSAEALPFRDCSVDAASAIAVLEHLDDDERAVSELSRVVRPNGRVWVTVPHCYRLMPPFWWPVYWLHDRRIGHKRHYDAARLQALFERHDFRLLELQFSGHPVKTVQLALSLATARTRIDVSSLWWALERADLRARRRPFWALQLSAVFERTVSP